MKKAIQHTIQKQLVLLSFRKTINMAPIKRVAILGGTGAQGSSVVKSK